MSYRIAIVGNNYYYYYQGDFERSKRKDACKSSCAMSGTKETFLTSPVLQTRSHPRSFQTVHPFTLPSTPSMLSSSPRSLAQTREGGHGSWPGCREGQAQREEGSNQAPPPIV